MTTGREFGTRKTIRAAGLIALLFIGLEAGLVHAQQGQGSPLASHGDLIQPGDLPPHLALALRHSGDRMTSADKAQVVLNGSVTDSAGIRAAQITIQAPGYFAFRDGKASLAFDGTSFKANTGAPGANDNPVMESLLAHFPDAVCLQAASGGSMRRIGTHFRADGSTGKAYSGPYWTVLAFSPASRNGISRGNALQQELFIAIDEQTGLIAEVRTVSGPGAKAPIVQTQFTAWTRQGNQLFPGKITRLENGKQTLAFQLQTATVGIAAPVAAFVP
jgi:hypothetical protein